MSSTASPSRSTSPNGGTPTARPSGGAGGGQQDFRMGGGAPQTAKPVLMTTLLAMTGLALLLYCIRREHLLGQIASPILTLATIHGSWRGGFRKVLMLGVGVGVLYLVCSYGLFADPVVQKFAGAASEIISSMIGVATAIGVYYIGLRIVRRFYRRHIANRSGRLSFDRFVGSLIGFAEGAIVILAVCWASVAVRSQSVIIRDSKDANIGDTQRRVARALVQVADEATAKPLGSVVAATNMIEKSPMLKGMMDHLNKTGELDLSCVSPEVRKKIDDVTKQVSKGQFNSFEQMLKSSERNSQIQQELQRRMPSSSHRAR